RETWRSGKIKPHAFAAIASHGVFKARSLKGTGINVVDLIRLKLGNGDSSSFWDDKWYAGGVIKELFPRLYALELHKHATVRMKLMAPSLDNSFHRRVRSGAEESQFNSLMEIVRVINLVPCEDRISAHASPRSAGLKCVSSIRMTCRMSKLKKQFRPDIVLFHTKRFSPFVFLASKDMSVLSDLFVAVRLGRAGVVPAGLSFSTGGVSNIWWGIVRTIVSAMSSMMSCAGVLIKKRVGDWEWADMMALYCQNATEEDSKFTRRVGALLEEMEAAYKERVDFIKELKAVSGVDAAVKTSEFLNDVLWKDERRLQRLSKLRMDADLMAYDKEKEITEDLRLAREINALCARVTATINQREMFVDELDMLAERHVPDKMADFMKQIQDVSRWCLWCKISLEYGNNVLYWIPGVCVSSLMGSLVPSVGCVANIVLARGESDLKDMFFTNDVHYFDGELSVSCFRIPLC
nr:RNA-directed DNA polymerase, eukaryota, reverse transcriptase zinc-binding domain protein [Tanacetum cinerariifolium]